MKFSQKLKNLGLQKSCAFEIRFCIYFFMTSFQFKSLLKLICFPVVPPNDRHAFQRSSSSFLEYETVQELSLVLESGEAEGLLLDSYIAGHYQELFAKFLLADILEYVFAYGMVLRNEGVLMNKCFRLYLDMNKDRMFYDISKALKPFKVSIKRCNSFKFLSSNIAIKAHFQYHSIHNTSIPCIATII